MGEKYAVIEQVRIEQADQKTVTFATRSASVSGHRDECLLRSFTCPVSEVWTHPITGAPAPVAMKPGAVGNLFLSSTGLQTRSADGYPIYGAGTPILRLKFPDKLAGSQLLDELTVTPSSIVVRGVLEGGSEFFDLELLGPDAAGAQSIAWNNAEHIQVHLTPRGARRLGLGEHAMTKKVWPTAIVVHGTPASDPSVSGSVDLLDSELAAYTGQRLGYAGHGAPVVLSLTQDGFAAFHVIPGLPDATPMRRRNAHQG